MSIVFDIETLEKIPSADGKRFKQVMVSPETLGSKEMEVSAITLRPGSEEPVHKHEGCLNLLYGLMGKGAVVLGGGERIEVEPDTLVWIDGGGAHKLVNDYDEDFIVVDIFSPPGAKTEEISQAEAKPSVAKVFRAKDQPVVIEKESGKRRIYLATPEMVGSEQAEGMIVTYTPGTFTPEHYHTTAESFFIPLWGDGFIWTKDGKFPMHRGKMAFFCRHERHALWNPNQEEFAFLEFHIPAYWDFNVVKPEEMVTSAPASKPELPKA